MEGRLRTSLTYLPKWFRPLHHLGGAIDPDHPVGERRASSEAPLISLDAWREEKPSDSPWKRSRQPRRDHLYISLEARTDGTSLGMTTSCRWLSPAGSECNSRWDDPGVAGYRACSRRRSRKTAPLDARRNTRSWDRLSARPPGQNAGTALRPESKKSRAAAAAVWGPCRSRIAAAGVNGISTPPGDSSPLVGRTSWLGQIG